MDAPWMTKGMDAIRAEIEKQKQNGNLKSKSNFLPEFYLKSEEPEALIQILDETPANAFIHTIKMLSKNNKTYYVSKTCAGERCGYCASVGVDERVGKRQFKSHISILDSRPLPYRVEGKDEDEPETPWTKRIWRLPPTRIDLILKNSLILKYGLRGAILAVTRSGENKDTRYNFEYVYPDKLEDYEKYASVVSGIGWDPNKDKFAPSPQGAEPFDFVKLLEPDTAEEAAAFLGKAQGQGKIEDVKEEDIL